MFKSLVNYISSLDPKDPVDYFYVISELRNEATRQNIKLDWVMDWSISEPMLTDPQISLENNYDKFQHFLNFPEPEMPAFIRNL